MTDRGADTTDRGGDTTDRGGVETVAEERLVIGGNTPVLLDDPAYLWIVESGSIALFGVPVVDGQPAGSRRYLFTVAAGQAAFGMAPDYGVSDLGILAVAIEQTELIKMPTRRLGEQITLEEDQRAFRLLEGWVRQISVALADVRRADGATLLSPDTKRYQLEDGHALLVPPDTVRWFQVLMGQTRWMGLDFEQLGPEAGILPFGPGMYVQADGPAMVVAVGTLAVGDIDFLLAGLAQLPSRFLFGLVVLEERETRLELQRIEEQAQLDVERSEEMLGDLAGLLGRAGGTIRRGGAPLLTAARAVGDALGIDLVPAPRRDAIRERDPVEAIALASRVQCRQVRLDGRWWKRDCGPLLGFRGEEGRPVALLRRQNGRYDCVDPSGGDTVPVDSGVAADLARAAYVFYRPFQRGPVGVVDLLRFALRGRARDLALLLGMGVASALLNMLVPLATGLLIDAAIPVGDRGLALQVGLGLAVVSLGVAIFQITQGLVGMRWGALIELSVVAAVWDRVLQLPAPFFRKFSVGDLRARIDGVNQISQKLSGLTLQSLFGGGFALLNYFLMLAYSPALAGVAAIVAFLAAALTLGAGIPMLRRHRKLEQVEGENFGLTVQLIGGVAKLRVAEAEIRAFAHWGRGYRQAQELTTQIRGLGNFLSVSQQALAAIATPVLFLVAAQTGLGGEAKALTTGAVLAFFAAYGAFSAGIASLTSVAMELVDVATILERTRPILETPVEVAAGRTDPGRLSGRIAVEHVSFKYRPDGPDILSDVTLSAEPGESIGLVGPSGSGKSTIFRLLLGFETPVTGAVLFDGQDLAHLDLISVRRQVGTVLQNAKLLPGTVFENIAAAAAISLDDAWEAARGAGLAEDIERLPMGMSTVISEGGGNFSGGQRQRLLIARALAFRPQVILFDEATSALDNRTQHIVTQSLARLKVTRIVIAHRLSTIQHVDRIYVLDRGRVVESGTFNELAAADGLFRKLAARQAV